MEPVVPFLWNNMFYRRITPYSNWKSKSLFSSHSQDRQNDKQALESIFFQNWVHAGESPPMISRFDDLRRLDISSRSQQTLNKNYIKANQQFQKKNLFRTILGTTITPLWQAACIQIELSPCILVRCTFRPIVLWAEYLCLHPGPSLFSPHIRLSHFTAWEKCRKNCEDSLKKQQNSQTKRLQRGSQRHGPQRNKTQRGVWGSYVCVLFVDQAHCFFFGFSLKLAQVRKSETTYSASSADLHHRDKVDYQV